MRGADVPPVHRPGTRVLLRNADGTVHLDGETLLVARCDGQALEHVILRITTFAFVVSGVVGALAVARVAPLPVGLFALTWAAGAGVALVWAARRRRQHGRFEIDLDTRRVHAATRAGVRDVPLDDAASAELSDPDEPGDHARWLLLRRGPELLRLGYGRPEELRAVLFVLRRHGVRAPHA